MKNPFEIITYWLSYHDMTAREKRSMRETLLSYTTDHPVKTGIMSPYVFRFASVALATLVIIFGGTVGVGSASMRSLPNQLLYPLKLRIEEFQSNRQPTAEAQIAFENKRIEARFSETAKLAMNQTLDESTAILIQSGLDHSQSRIKTLASSLQVSNPGLALEATNTLEATFSSSGKLLARIEQTTGQNVQPIVLAAEASTKKISLEKVSLEKLVALQPNELTKEMVLKRFAELQKIIPFNQPSAPTTLDTTSDTESLSQEMELGSTSATSDSIPVQVKEEKIPIDPLIPLMHEVQDKIHAQAYSEALVIIKKIDQMLQEAEHTKKLETEYKLPALPESTETKDTTSGENTSDLSHPEQGTPVLPSSDNDKIIPKSTENLPVSDQGLSKKTV